MQTKNSCGITPYEILPGNLEDASYLDKVLRVYPKKNIQVSRKYVWKLYGRVPR
jgi:hypothetical protein